MCVVCENEVGWFHTVVPIHFPASSTRGVVAKTISSGVYHKRSMFYLCFADPAKLHRVQPWNSQMTQMNFES